MPSQRFLQWLLYEGLLLQWRDRSGFYQIPY